MEEIEVALNGVEPDEEDCENDEQYEKVILVSPSIRNYEEMARSEPIYVNMPTSMQTTANLESIGFDVNPILAEQQIETAEDEYRRLSNEKNEKTQDENFDNELMELNNQIKQLLVDNEQNRKGTTIEEPVNIKPTPAVRPKSANYLNARKTAAPPPPPSVQANMMRPELEIAKRRAALKANEDNCQQKEQQSNDSSMSTTRDR